MKSVVFVIDTLEIGGAENSLIGIYKSLKENIDLSIIVLKNKSNLNNKIPLIEFKARKIISLKSIQKMYKFLINNEDCIIFSFAPEIAALVNLVNLFCFKKHISIVSFRNSFKYYKELKRLFRFHFICLLLLPSFGFHFLTKSNMDSYYDYFPFKLFFKSKFKCIIPNYLRKMEKFYYSRPENKIKPQIIFVGRLIEQKRPLDFVKFCSIVNTFAPNKFTFHIFGIGPLESNVSKAIKQKSLEHQFKLHGKVKNIAEYLDNPYALIVTSSYEGHPGVVGEAILSGIPVLSYPYDSFIKYFMDDCNFSRISLESNPESLFKSFLSLHNKYSEYEKEIFEDRKLILRKFSNAKLTKLWFSFFNKLNND